jgi:membrane fusion protein (multidrug efflux system)
VTTTAPPGGIDVPSPPAPREVPRARSRSWRAFLVVGVVLVAIVATALVWWLTTRGKESTDDAEVQADVVTLSPQAGGLVSRVLVQENQHVKKGDELLAIDDADLAVKVRQAEAQLAAAQAALVKAAPEARIDQRQLERSERLVETQAINEQQLEQSQLTARSGQAGLLQARANLAAAKAALETARLQLSYAKVFAPTDGWVSNVTARAGQTIANDQPFAQLVPDHAYVVANFKETQIGQMHPGRRATVSIDAYGHRPLEARVESLSRGTGAEFSLLPASNATGNFVKVVQRVPVRLELLNPPSDLPLRAGLSATVTVYLR